MEIETKTATVKMTKPKPVRNLITEVSKSNLSIFPGTMPFNILAKGNIRPIE